MVLCVGHNTQFSPADGKGRPQGAQEGGSPWIRKSLEKCLVMHNLKIQNQDN